MNPSDKNYVMSEDEFQKIRDHWYRAGELDEDEVFKLISSLMTLLPHGRKIGKVENRA
jgi:hypothetical protein